MSITELKSKFKEIIDDSNDKESLEQFYWAFKTSKEVDLWDTLSVSQKKYVLNSYEESFSEENLIGDETVKERLKKYFGNKMD
ncbi:MAG TPA: hypothetical protein VHP32_07570 [Ignavibacteria bacterium]|nr:hypothetical protein [Ignavibacteria bacterium]